MRHRQFRFWPADHYEPGHGQPSFDKQFVRDSPTSTGRDKNSNPPPLPDESSANPRQITSRPSSSSPAATSSGSRPSVPRASCPCCRHGQRHWRDASGTVASGTVASGTVASGTVTSSSATGIFARASVPTGDGESSKRSLIPFTDGLDPSVVGLRSDATGLLPRGNG